ncbi:MAG: kinase [Brevundimonas sp.]|uniref:D-glycerate 3-kinase n=1 Tax=Brevundimonas mediterranea TaxID=74329 RepID=A0A7W6A8H5_9CAUL|nr:MULTISPECIES: kinase [Brevundimonas]MBB3872453.1 D-glycerate 3-kinase [Brevundimonas mediterranea]MDK2747269.1 kinase [Brevundimonas sp.]
MTGSLERVEQALDGWRGSQPLVLGICGAQGSGKSTLSDALAERLNGRGIRTAVLSLDDLYLSRARRADLARAVHPLFKTRGVPGTHDVALGVALLDAVRTGRGVTLPRFDKGIDDPVPRAEWPVMEGPVDVLIFEGWCIGARAQDVAALNDPINGLERDSDAEGVWRRHANAALAGAYADLFGRLDRLVLLAAPEFGVVERWRLEQEHALRLRAGGRGMSDAEIAIFVQHYERLTRHILSDMPAYADLTIRLDEARRPRETP